MAKLCCSLLLLFLLNACTGVAVKDSGSADTEAYQLRASFLTGIKEWGLKGKISLDDGDQGGSGKLQWRVKPDISELDFHAVMGRGAWNLQIGPDQAILTEANGDVQAAGNVNSLLQNRMGWPIPVEALQWWVRGLAAPGEIEGRKINSTGLLTSLRQFGWSIEFSRYDTGGSVAMPKKLNATMDNYRVKMAIARWQIIDAKATDD